MDLDFSRIAYPTFNVVQDHSIYLQNTREWDHQSLKERNHKKISVRVLCGEGDNLWNIFTA